MQFLFILIDIISVHATPEEDADVRDTTPYGADAQTLLATVGAAAALCQIVQVVAHRCVKLQGHRGFCNRVSLDVQKTGAVPQQQQPAPELPQTTLGPSPFSFFGKVHKLKEPNADYRISARSGKSIFTLPCSVSGKKCRHRNRDWHRIVPSSLDSAVVQSSELGSNLECCYGQRFQVNSKSAPKVVVTPLKWPLTNKTVPAPSVELLLCCHTCYLVTLFSQAPAAPYPVVDPVV